jgi:CBS domain-containing protein
MTNRKVAYIVKDQKPLVLTAHETVQHACLCMRERRAGSVLVIDEQQRLSGIFTGRDAVRTLAEGKDAAMTRKKVEMLFAHLKRNLRFERLRLRGLSGASDEFLLAATVQNLRRLAKLVGEPPTPKVVPA